MSVIALFWMLKIESLKSNNLGALILNLRNV